MLIVEKVVLEIMPIVLASVSIALSYYTFKRQRTFENENHVFKYKLEKYHETLNIFRNLFSFIEEKIIESYGMFFDDPTDDQIDLIQEELEDNLSDIELEIFSTVAFFPEAVFKKIDDLVEKLSQANFLEHGIHTKKKYDSDLKNLDAIENLIYIIADTMREDLRIDTLNMQLHRRIRPMDRLNPR